MTVKTTEATEAGGALLFRLIRALGVVENDEIRCCGVTTAQGLALLALAAQHPVRMRHLADTLGVSPGTATRIVDNLVRERLVERSENPADRRAVWVQPSSLGENKIRQLQKCYSRFWERIFSAIPGNKLPEVLSSLEILVSAAEGVRESCCPIGDG